MPPHPPDRCSRGHFLCRRPPVCIPDWQRCDGRLHCQDGSDEAQCRESPVRWEGTVLLAAVLTGLCLPAATRGPLFCLNGTLCWDGEACVLDSERCDGFLDCSDRSDEDNCTSRSHKA